MESHHQQIHQAKNSQENTKKSNYVIVREDQEVEGTPSTKKLQAFPPPKCSYPPGYRFMPTDDELILEYLQKKVDNQPIPIREITDVYLKQNNPKALTATYPKLGENEWYFFTPRDRKYPNGSRPNRAADTGYWKATGADKPVKFQGNVVGFRKALVFYEGKPPKGQKTSWIMHEFRLNRLPRTKRNAEDMRLDDWVLCRIYEKTSRPNNRNRQGNEGGDLSVDDDDQNRLQVNTDNEALMSHDEDNAAAFVDNNENLGEFDMAENLAPFADHWLQQSLVISPDHHSMDEPALINGHIQLDYGLLNTAGHLQQNAFSGTPCLNEQDHQQALIGFQQGDFLASWGNGTFQQLPSYLGSSSSSKSNSINTTSYDSFSFMKIENSFNGVVTSNPDYDPYMPRKRRL